VLRFSHIDTDVTSGIPIPGADDSECDDQDTLVGSTGGSEITFARSRIYNIASSAQSRRAQGGAASTLSVLLRRDCADLPLTNTDFTTDASDDDGRDVYALAATGLRATLRVSPVGW
jgi:hypothetical protein